MLAATSKPWTCLFVLALTLSGAAALVRDLTGRDARAHGPGGVERDVVRSGGAVGARQRGTRLTIRAVERE
jgi:hypothetical protein